GAVLVGQPGERVAPVDSHDAAGGVVAAVVGDGGGGAADGLVEPAGPGAGRVVAPRPVAAVEGERRRRAGVRRAKEHGDGLGADGQPALVAAVAEHVVLHVGLVQVVEVPLFDVG